MAICLALLVISGLLVRCLRNLQNVDPGFHSSGLLVFGITPLQSSHSDQEVFRVYRSLLDRLRALPGVESATILEERIGTGESNNTAAMVDGRNPRGGIPSMMRWNVVGPDFLRTLGIHLVLGRDFSDADSESSPHVAIVNETFAQRYLPGQVAIGHRIGLGKKEESQYTIIGVASDSKYTGVREDRKPIAYFPYTQVPGIGAMNFEVRSDIASDLLLPEVQRAVHEIAPESPLINPVSQKAQLEQSYAQERLFARLSSFFGLLAALLVATGLFGTSAYRVSQRTEEIGVRMALGAQRVQVLWMVIREALMISAFGIIVGLPLSLGAARMLRSMLYGVGPNDLLTFAAAFFGIVAIAVVASFVPALRAACVDPLVALRYE